MSALLAFAEMCAASLRVPVSDVRILFTVSGARLRCAVSVGGDRTAIFFGDGPDEAAAMAAVRSEAEKTRATTLASEIERLEVRERHAKAAADLAERRRDEKEKELRLSELRLSEERAARAAKAFQDALRGAGDNGPRVLSAAEHAGIGAGGGDEDG